MARTRSKTVADGTALDEYRRKRDFGRTPEPEGGAPAGLRGGQAALEFVVQKHAASHLHFDFRLELGGAMKSWAVPKGPSLDPAVRRLAMETEDHPMAYNAFEGIIPKGEYGGGTVMIWDRGRYRADDASPGEDEKVLRRGYRQGKLSFTLEGERLRGSWALVRTRGRGSDRAWLLLKHRDTHASAERDIVAEFDRSVVSGRTLDEIATGKSKVWHSNRQHAGPPAETGNAASPAAAAPIGAATAAAIRPMQPASAQKAPAGGDWSFEPAHGGTRLLAWVTPDTVKLTTTRGADRGPQHPAIVAELVRLPGRRRRSFVLDTELVTPPHGDALLYVTDLLLEDGEPLLDLPWHERRTRLEQLFRRRAQRLVRIAANFPDHDAAIRAARHDGSSAIVAKRRDAPYRPGTRSRAWLRIPLPRS
jgi:bifunctional non-homologous end joining protein LigD